MRDFFYRVPVREHHRWASLRAQRHSQQLFEEFPFQCSAYIRQSAFGFVRVYNALPQWVIELPVRGYQRALQQVILAKARAQDEHWPLFFRNSACTNVSEFQRCFQAV